MTVRYLIALVAIGAAFSNLGCAQNRWARTYEPVDESHFSRSEETAVRFEQVPYSELDRSRELSGFKIIGVSQFRAPIQRERPGTRGSGLRAHAADVGAELVRWAEAPIGTVGAGYVHQGDGRMASVTRTDYLAIYYRRIPE